MEYIASADQQALSERHKKAAVVVAALGASVMVYSLVAWLIPPAQLSSRSGGRAFYYAVYGAALVMGFAVVVLRRLWLSQFRLNLALRRGLGAMLGSLSLASILGAALGDAIGILGLVAYLMTGDREFSWRLGVVGLLLIIYSYPRRGEWERAVSTATRETTSSEFKATG